MPRVSHLHAGSSKSRSDAKMLNYRPTKHLVVRNSICIRLAGPCHNAAIICSITRLLSLKRMVLQSLAVVTQRINIRPLADRLDVIRSAYIMLSCCLQQVSAHCRPINTICPGNHAAAPAYILEEETVRSKRSSIDLDFSSQPESSSRLSWQSGSSPCLSNPPSPRISGRISPQVAPTSAADSCEKSAKIYSTLVDLLQTAEFGLRCCHPDHAVRQCSARSFPSSNAALRIRLPISIVTSF